MNLIVLDLLSVTSLGAFVPPGYGIGCREVVKCVVGNASVGVAKLGWSRKSYSKDRSIVDR